MQHFFAHPGCDASVTVWAVRHASLIIIRARNQVSRKDSDAEAAKTTNRIQNKTNRMRVWDSRHLVHTDPCVRLNMVFMSRPT